MKHALICVVRAVSSSQGKYAIAFIFCLDSSYSSKFAIFQVTKKQIWSCSLLPFIFIRSARCYIIEFYYTFYHVFALQLCTALFVFSSLATVGNCSQYGLVVEQHFFASQSLIWWVLTTSTSFSRDRLNGPKKIARAMQSRLFANQQTSNGSMMLQLYLVTDLFSYCDCFENCW